MDKYVRINKFISTYGDISRRKADEYIEQGRITINGITINEPGFNVNPSRDKIRIDGELVKISDKKIYIILNKPLKVISTVSDDKHRTTVIDLVKIKDKVYPVGRLDYDSTGLILLTNDGELTNKLMHPKYRVDKTYLVKINRPLDEKHRKILERGVVIEGKKTAPAKIRFVNKNDYKKLYITIHEGRNRQVRKMFKILGYKVEKLHRTQYGSLKLGTLLPGKWRYLTKSELRSLFNDTKNN